MDDECLKEILGDAYVAKDFALDDMDDCRRKTGKLPKACSATFKAAEAALEDVEHGRVAAQYRCKRAALAVRKFGEARTAARVLMGDVGFVSGRDRAYLPVRRRTRRRR